jgi:hypothetical protein
VRKPGNDGCPGMYVSGRDMLFLTSRLMAPGESFKGGFEPVTEVYYSLEQHLPAIFICKIVGAAFMVELRLDSRPLTAPAQLLRA